MKNYTDKYLFTVIFKIRNHFLLRIVKKYFSKIISPPPLPLPKEVILLSSSEKSTSEWFYESAEKHFTKVNRKILLILLFMYYWQIIFDIIKISLGIYFYVLWANRLFYVYKWKIRNIIYICLLYLF